MTYSVASSGTSTSGMDDVLGHELRELGDAGLRRRLRTVERRPGAELVSEGCRYADFASNDYLGLGADPRLAAALTARSHATGAGAARLITGNSAEHEALERELAEFKGTEAALTFGSGYLANTGAIPALVGRGDVIYADALNHASLIDGCRLSRAELRVIPHRDVVALESALLVDAERFRRRLIVTDSVFSMDGALAPLRKIVDLARAHDAWTYVDDAHGTGVLGEHGRGATELLGVEGEIDVMMGTLGKALGTSGAFIAGSRALIELLLNKARSFVFTTAQPIPIVAATREALRIVRLEPERRARLAENGACLRRALMTRGIEMPDDSVPHLIVIHTGTPEATMRAADRLREHGFLVGAVRPPTVPAGTSRLRITISAAHTPEQIDGLASALQA